MDKLLRPFTTLLVLQIHVETCHLASTAALQGALQKLATWHLLLQCVSACCRVRGDVLWQCPAVAQQSPQPLQVLPPVLATIGFCLN
eukprot:5124281-Amphidinium_carterae.1